MSHSGEHVIKPDISPSSMESRGMEMAVFSSQWKGASYPFTLVSGCSLDQSQMLDFK